MFDKRGIRSSEDMTRIDRIAVNRLNASAAQEVRNEASGHRNP
jgi:hypothetical protein